jgi:hypothetical protein
MPEVTLLDASAKGPYHAQAPPHRIGSNDLPEESIAD